ncbi:MAG: hypothetical protein ACYC6Y_29560, partial [Thermoguttaceae bacterium]
MSIERPVFELRVLLRDRLQRQCMLLEGCGLLVEDLSDSIPQLLDLHRGGGQPDGIEQVFLLKPQLENLPSKRVGGEQFLFVDFLTIADRVVDSHLVEKDGVGPQVRFYHLRHHRTAKGLLLGFEGL